MASVQQSSVSARAYRVMQGTGDDEVDLECEFVPALVSGMNRVAVSSPIHILARVAPLKPHLSRGALERLNQPLMAQTRGSAHHTSWSLQRRRSYLQGAPLSERLQRTPYLLPVAGVSEERMSISQMQIAPLPSAFRSYVRVRGGGGMAQEPPAQC